MKKSIFITIIMTLLFALAITYTLLLHEFPKIADTVIYGKIYTGIDQEKTSEALAIKDGEFIYIGNSNDVSKHIGNDTKVLNYKDEFVISGFTDTHTHVTSSFGTIEYQFNIQEAETVEEYIEIISNYIKEHPDKEMYVGRGWNYMLFKNGTPTKDILDELAPNKPIFIKSGDGHSGWANSKMIELTGVNKDTPNPIGGEIVKDENGEPTGCFKDSAMDEYLKPNVTPYTIEEYKYIINKAQDYYAELGYTAYIEVLVDSDKANFNLYKAYEELDKEGKLKLRVQAAWNVANNENSLEKVKEIIKYKDESKGGMFELTDIKIFMDGVAETETAFFSEPYADNPENYGADRWPGEESFNRLVDIIELANRNGMVVHFHAIGDAAITKALDAQEEARKRYIDNNIHNVITHLESVKESDIKRFKELDIVISADLAWGIIDSEVYENVEVKKLGEERAFKAYPYKSVLDSGAVVSSATDYPAVPVSSPISAFIVAVNRNATDNKEYTRDPSQKMTVQEALKCLTYSGAYQMRQENFRGTIEVGKKADLIIIDKNLLEEYSINVLDAKLLLNMVNGKINYQSK